MYGEEGYDKMITAAGTYGVYQKLIALMVILTVLYSPYVVLTLSVNQMVPPFKYVHRNSTLLTEEFKYVENKTEFCNEIYFSYNFNDIKNSIIFDDQDHKFRNNWATELKLVCNTKLIFSLIGTIYFIASIAGYLALGKFPDRYGRKKVFLYLNLACCFSYAQMFFLNNFIQLLLVAFASGLAGINLGLGSVIISENFDPKYAGITIGIAMAMFPLGGIINIFFIYFFNDWKFYFTIMLIGMSYGTYLGFKYMEESPRWLLANNKKAEFMEVMYAIAKINKRESELKSCINQLKKEIVRSDAQSQKEIYHELTKGECRKHVYEVTDLFCYPSTCKITVCSLFLWIVSGFSFYGVFLSLSELTGCVYVDSVVAYTAEIFAEIASGFIADKYGRKTTVFYSFLIAFIGNLLFLFSSYYISLILLFVSCIGVASAFNVLYIYSAELYPTNVKSLAVSILFLSNRMSAGIVPYLLTIIPNAVLIIAILSGLSVIVVSFLEESLGRNSGTEVPEITGIIYKDNDSKCEDFVSFYKVFEESF